MGWAFDPASTQVLWETTHLGLIKVRGGFREVSVVADMEAEDPANWSVQVEIAAASLDSWAERRDSAMLKADYFNAERFPTIVFRSRQVERTADGGLLVRGDLTMVGVTRPVSLDARLNAETVDPRGMGRRGFSASTTVRWSDFVPPGEGRGGWDNSIFRDEIGIDVQIEFVRQPDPQPA
jgi:polyisoprenoid-binding protein YceI